MTGNQQSKQEQAEQIIKRSVMYALAVGALPLPVVDVALITSIQLNMVRKLTLLYDVPFSKELGKSLIAALVSSGSTVSFSSMAKVIPGYGLLAGVLAVSVLAGASTHAVGKVFVQHFESGGTFLTFDPRAVRDFYKSQFAQGKKEVEKRVTGRKP